MSPYKFINFFHRNKYKKGKAPIDSVNKSLTKDKTDITPLVAPL